ncbi:M20 family metallopeptidase [Halotalea alkalilenta]|uniref:Acetylornithine deacetylase n=1 Tax=Halotalea alkalilenta TaxID=376489 RepID=A0A172YIH9_9GAMM|nr:M20 family metallopeptidase [Halotalea alkalilenta]ANF58865.1 acetylornithine deacetylase [Halotalea alkalilenta]
MSFIERTSLGGLLAGLVECDTQNPPGAEGDAAALVEARLAALGFDTELDEFAPGRVNLVARLVNGEGPRLAFNTHFDVVPVGQGWASDPLRLDEREGRLYGRGACDAKGQIAAMVEALARLSKDRDGWRGTLLAVFVADEEVGSLGARRFKQRYAEYAPIDHVIVGEPTGNRPVNAHKGSLRPVVAVRGRSAHSGTPELGVNAIYAAARLCAAVDELHQQVRERNHPSVGRAALSVTRIHGGHADNVVPERCELMLDRRMIPGEKEQDAIAEIEALLARLDAEHGIEAAIERFQATTGGASETQPSSAVVCAALEAARAHGVAVEAPGGFPGGCDLVHFRELGIPGVVIGPGDLGVAHQPNEFVPIDELESAVAIYADIARRLLPVEPRG